jgi:hypothetical protein
MMQAEIDAFHKKIRAKALVVAVEWAGSADALARMAGLSRHTGQKWTQRGFIPPPAALSLSRIRGFPLTFGEMCPGIDEIAARARRCPHCDLEIRPIGRPTSSPCLLKRRSEAAARKLAAQTPGAIQKARIAKRKARNVS